MLDIKVIREDPERVKKAVKSRNMNLDAEIDELLAIDTERRQMTARGDALKQKQNEASKKIPALKKAGEDTSALFAEMGRIKADVKELDKLQSELEARQKAILLEIPNLPDTSVPLGKDDTENVEIRRFGEPTEFDFAPKAHWDLGKDLDILDPEIAAKVTGARFHFYKGQGAKLERSVINYYLNTHTEHGYTEILPPFLVNRA
ncbi:MAG TPA: serine--tRNA ligase, partial [Clostridiales bacterium]|nr:serine--tRNA ligase [Clostridiales bacterium]